MVPGKPIPHQDKPQWVPHQGVELAGPQSQRHCYQKQHPLEEVRKVWAVRELRAPEEGKHLAQGPEDEALAGWRALEEEAALHEVPHAAPEVKAKAQPQGIR